MMCRRLPAGAGWGAEITISPVPMTAAPGPPVRKAVAIWGPWASPARTSR